MRPHPLLASPQFRAALISTIRRDWLTWAHIRHSGAVRFGLDGRTVAIGVFAVVLALVLGAVAGTEVGAAAGALAALAGLISPVVLEVALKRRQRNIARMKTRQEVLRRFAPPKPAGDRDGEK